MNDAQQRSSEGDETPNVIAWNPPDEHEWLHYDSDFHGYLTPAGALARRPTAALALLIGLVVLAIVAAIDTGALLDTWDEPIQEWVESQRTDAAESFSRAISSLGSNIVIFPVGAIMAIIAWFRCRPLAVAIVIAIALRPGLEFLLLNAVGRPRPDLDRLVNDGGFAHPSGHVFATVSLYALLPAVVALYGGRRRLWRFTWVLVSLLPLLMIATRVCLGMHWATDAVAGMLWGAVYLAGVGMLFDRHHIGQCGHHSNDWRDHSEHPHHLEMHHLRHGSE